MTTIGNSNLLSRNYTASTLNQNQLKKLENNQTTKDNVLDLSGDPGQIANEIKHQDISLIKAININGKLVQLKPNEVKELVAELKAKCLDGSGNLKEDIKFVDFQKATGIRKFSGIQVIQTKVSPDSIINQSKLSEDIENKFKNLGKPDFFARIKDGNTGSIPKLQGALANAKNEEIKSINVQIEKLQKEITLLENSPQNSELKIRLESLNEQREALSTLKDVLTTKRDIHLCLSKMPVAELRETPKDQLIKLQELNNKFSNSVNKLKNLTSQNKFISENPEIIKNISITVKGAEESSKLITDLLSCTKNASFINAKKQFGKMVSFPSMLEQYRGFVLGVNNGSIADLPPNIKGFTQFAFNELNNSYHFSSKFNGVSNYINKIDFKTLTDEQILVERQKVKGMINSALGGIGQTNRDKAMNLYLSKFDLALAYSKSGTISTVQDKENVEKMTESADKQVNKVGDTRDFGKPAGGTLSAHTKEVKAKSVEVKESVEKVTTSTEFIVKNPSQLNKFFSSLKESGENKYLKVELSAQISAKLKIGVNAGFTIEARKDDDGQVLLTIKGEQGADIGVGLGKYLRASIGVGGAEGFTKRFKNVHEANAFITNIMNGNTDAAAKMGENIISKEGAVKGKANINIPNILGIDVSTEVRYGIHTIIDKTGKQQNCTKTSATISGKLELLNTITGSYTQTLTHTEGETSAENNGLINKIELKLSVDFGKIRTQGDSVKIVLKEAIKQLNIPENQKNELLSKLLLIANSNSTKVDFTYQMIFENQGSKGDGNPKSIFDGGKTEHLHTTRLLVNKSVGFNVEVDAKLANIEIDARAGEEKVSSSTFGTGDITFIQGQYKNDPEQYQKIKKQLGNTPVQGKTLAQWEILWKQNKYD